jgi:hypothetical protein
MYYSYVEIEYVATSFSPARTDLALKLLKLLKGKHKCVMRDVSHSTTDMISKIL